MTSFIIKDHLERPQAPSWTPDTDETCTFCHIIQNKIPAHRIFEDDEVIVILDILPLRRGHTLVIPKVHCGRVSELPPSYAAATGKAVSKVARALTEAVDNTALNVVCNQEYAQAVPHVHYHIIPAPKFGPSLGSPGTGNTNAVPSQPRTTKEMHRLEFESREELDEDDAVVLAKDIRARL